MRIPSKMQVLSVFLFFCLSMYGAENGWVLRFPVQVGRDGSRTISQGSTSMLLPPDAGPGHRFSWQGSFYELVEYASGIFATLSLDPGMEGKSLGHVLFLLDRAEPENPIPEWVSDDRALLTGVPAYEGYLAVRSAKGYEDEDVSASAILQEQLEPLIWAGKGRTVREGRLGLSAEEVRSSVAYVAKALARKAELSSYWMKILQIEKASGGKVRETTTRRVYGLVLVSGTDYTEAIQNLKSEISRIIPGSAPDARNDLVATFERLTPKTSLAASRKPAPPAPDGSILLPPVLSIQDIAFSDAFLEGGRQVQISVTLRNVGPGEGRDVTLEIESVAPGISHPKVIKVPAIPATSGIQIVKIPLECSSDLGDGEASFLIRVVEPNFKVKVTGKRILIPTVAMKAPKLVVAKYAVVEVTSSSPNGQVDLNEVVDLRIALQNQGSGDARDVRVEVLNSQKGVMFLGIVEGSEVKKGTFGFTSIESGKYKDLAFRYFVNSEFNDKELSFTIRASEGTGKYGTSVSRSVALNAQLREVGEIVRVTPGTPKSTGTVIIEDMPDFVPDVRENIPEGRIQRPDAVAVIIGNRTYRTKGVPPVDYATNDAELIRKYLMRTFGFREGNIIFLADATQADFNMVFGTVSDPKGKLFNYIKKDVSDVFIYYSGHGAPSADGQSAYFVPVDCDPAFVRLNGYSLDTFYGNLRKLPFKSLTVVIDSCFSGGFDKGMLLTGISGLTVVPKVEESMKPLERGNVAIFTSTTGSQVSTWYPDKQHSLFTYYFAKGIQELSAKHPSAILSGELQSFILREVSYMSRRLNGREQTPVYTGIADFKIVEPK